MVNSALIRLRQIDDVQLAPPVEPAELERALAQRGVQLPADHFDFLSKANGATAFAGYFRIFGIGAGWPDAGEWNSSDCWKFAWAGRCSGYWCFGETAWGDQYAYRLGNEPDGTVYFLDALSMSPTTVAPSFGDFLETEFLRCALAPYDGMTTRARQRFGPLEAREHLVYSPSILLGGEERIEFVQKMDARAAMIANGDIAVQLDTGPLDAQVKGVRPVHDEQGRARLRLEWA